MSAILEPLATMTSPNAHSDQVPPGTASSSKQETKYATSWCNNLAVPGDDYCGACLTSYPDGGNGGDGSNSDGTNASNDPNGGWVDGTLRAGRNSIEWTRGVATPVPELKKLRARSSGHANAERRAWMLDAALSDATSEFRVSTNTTSGTIVTGQAIVYGVRTIIHDRFGKFGETIKRGAAGHLLKGDVRLLFDHDGLPLGRTISTTLALNETASGVNFAAYLDDTAPLAQNVLSGIRRGDLSGCSFAFAVNEAFDQWNAAMTERTITRFASIPEVSVVTFPAYPTTTVSLDEARKQDLDLKRREIQITRERMRRSAGLIGDHMTQTDTLPERDDLSAEQCSIETAGELRKAAMQEEDVKSYRSLRVRLNSGRDLEEVR